MLESLESERHNSRDKIAELTATCTSLGEQMEQYQKDDQKKDEVINGLKDQLEKLQT